MGSGAPLSRRRLARGAMLGAGVLATLGLTRGDASERWTQVPLYSSTVAMTSRAQRTLIRPGTDLLLPDTRIARHAREKDQLLAAEDALLLSVRQAALRAGLSEARSDQLRDAALDLHVLSFALAAPVAGWSRNWRYVWPRDAAHAAVAFAHLGLPQRAAGIVRELASLAGPDGWFEARYRPGTSKSPDDRERQLDGTGWLLWAIDEVSRFGAEHLLQDETVHAAARHGTDLLLRLTASTPHLPPPSPDYWERRERRLTIATAALAMVGLERAGRVLADADRDRADAASSRSTQVRAAIRSTFGPKGYGRYPRRDLPDAGMLFLLPPYALEVDDRVAEHVPDLEHAASRPAGGVAPGAGWRRDGITWTPQTAMLARARREIGDQQAADRLLDWLAAHRTDAGSLPEKVLADGRPAAVAPLAWTAALVADTVVA